MSGTSWRYRRRGPTDPNLLGAARSFPTEIGTQVGDGEVRGYYFDFRFKAESTRWPPELLTPEQLLFHVEPAQWGLGCYERFLAGEGDEWLAAAVRCGDHLLAIQEAGGPLDGAWLHEVPMPHTYELAPPWVSGMAQGECASLLVRLHAATGEERWAEAAHRALGPAKLSSRAGGAQALLDGRPFPEEYPTDPPSFVLNGGIFAIWGFHDVAVGLGDPEAIADAEERIDGLAENIRRWDTGSWSLYDLFPHPLPNIASAAYHHLHVAQLRAMALVAPRQEFEEAANRWEGYSRSRGAVGGAFARKVGFRLAVPRTRSLAHRLPWSHSRRRRARGPGVAGPLVLAYHAVSPDWPSPLAVTPERLRAQLEPLVRRGYRGVTFAQVARGEGDRRTVAVTFDDGYRSVLEHGLPVLAELGLPGTIFVPTDYVGLAGPMSWPGIDGWAGGPYEDELLPLSWDQLRDLQGEGWEIGSHTRSHPRLPTLAHEALAEELRGSRECCTRELGRDCESVAYPYGDFDDRVASAAEAAGYLAAATMRPGPQRRYAWPRIGAYPKDARLRFALKASPMIRRLRA